MRCLQHVLWRGGLALGLLVSGGTGAMLMPQPESPTCTAETQDPRAADAIDAPLARNIDGADKAPHRAASINTRGFDSRATS